MTRKSRFTDRRDFDGPEARFEISGVFRADKGGSGAYLGFIMIFAISTRVCFRSIREHLANDLGISARPSGAKILLLEGKNLRPENFSSEKFLQRKIFANFNLKNFSNKNFWKNFSGENAELRFWGLGRSKKVCRRQIGRRPLTNQKGRPATANVKFYIVKFWKLKFLIFIFDFSKIKNLFFYSLH